MPENLHLDTKVEGWALWFCLRPLNKTIIMRSFTLYIILLISLAGCTYSGGDSGITRAQDSNKTDEYKNYKIAEKKLESFKVFNDDFISRYREYLSLKQEFGNTNDTNIILDLKRLKEYIFLPYKYQDLKKIELKYLDTLSDQEFREKIYVELFEKSISSADIEDVLFYDSILQANNFIIVDENYLNRSEQIKNIKSELKELENKSLPGDEYLFKKASSYSKLNFLGRGMEGHVFDVTSSTNYYKELIENYPNSKYVLDAKLVIICYTTDYIFNNTEPFNYFNVGGMTTLDKYEGLLKKTIDIEQRSKIYFAIAEKFNNCEFCSEDPTAMATTKKYLEKILKENPEFDKIDKVKEMLKNVGKAKGNS